MDKYKESWDTWNAIASEYQDKFMHLDLYNDTYDHICHSIVKPNAKLLEIGCGPGNITQYLLTKRPDFDLFGIDIAPRMIELARHNNPSAQFRVMDTRDIGQLDPGFDGLIGGFCLPFLSDAEVKDLINNAYHLLNDQGLLYLSFVDGQPERSGYKVGPEGRVYFHYHDLKDVEAHLLEANFQELRAFHVPYRISVSEHEMHTILTARKNRAF